jgi:N-acetylglucosamine-6-phosphate deacetylase
MIIQSNRVYIDEKYQPAQLVLENGKILRIQKYNKEAADKDYENNRIIPGLIEMHAHGYNGMDVNFGYCTPGKEVHVIRGYTNNSETKINVFDIVRNIHYTINGGWT